MDISQTSKIPPEETKLVPWCNILLKQSLKLAFNILPQMPTSVGNGDNFKLAPLKMVQKMPVHCRKWGQQYDSIQHVAPPTFNIGRLTTSRYPTSDHENGKPTRSILGAPPHETQARIKLYIWHTVFVENIFSIAKIYTSFSIICANFDLGQSK